MREWAHDERSWLRACVRGGDTDEQIAAWSGRSIGDVRAMIAAQFPDGRPVVERAEAALPYMEPPGRRLPGRPSRAGRMSAAAVMAEIADGRSQREVALMAGVSSVRISQVVTAYRERVA